MADIGVLSLQIKSNAGKAASNLSRLATALERIRSAVNSKSTNNLNNLADALSRIKAATSSGMNSSQITKVANSISKAVNTMASDGTARKLTTVSKALERFSAAYQSLGGVGNIKNASSTGLMKLNLQQFGRKKQVAGQTEMDLDNLKTSITETFSQMEGAIQTATNAATEYMAKLSDTSAVENQKESVKEMNDELERSSQIFQQASMSFGGSDTFAKMFTMWNASRMGRSLGSGMLGLPAGAIYAEGTVSDSYSSIGLSSGADFVTPVNEFRDFQSAMDDTSGHSTALQGQLQSLDGELKAKKTDTERASSGFKSMGSSMRKAKEDADDTEGSMKGLSFSLKDLVPNLYKVATQFGRILLRRAITSVIRSITSAFSDGIENVYRYSDAIGSSFAPALDSAASMVSQFKNTLGAAASSLLNSLIPVFNSIVDAAITVINYINQLFALLSGSSTWTKALAVETSAFDDVADSASSAGGAVSDMLQDFDELNVLDSSSGGGGSSAADTVTDYTTMFEESSEFDTWIKDLVTWLEEHLPVVNGLVAALLASLLGLPAMTSIGIGFLVTGLDTSYNAGKDVGENGEFTLDNLKNTVLGLFESGLGGALIGYSLAGVAGAWLGLTLGIAVGLVVWSVGVQEGYKSTIFGDLTYTKTEIEESIKEDFYFEVSPQIEILKAKIVSNNDLKDSINEELADINIFQMLIDKSAYSEVDTDALAEKVKSLVSDTQSLIEGKKEYCLMITAEINGEITEDALLASEGWTILSGIVGDLGTEIGKILSDNTIDEYEKTVLPGLLTALTEISTAVTNGVKQENYTSASTDIREAFESGNLSSQSFNDYVQSLIDLNDQTYQDAKNSVDEAAAYYNSEIAGLEAAKENGYTEWKGMDIDTALENAKTEYEKYSGENRQSAINALYNTWTSGQTTAQKNTLISGYTSLFNNDSTKSTTLMNEIFGDIRYKPEVSTNLDSVVTEAIAYITGQSTDTVIQAKELFNVTGWDLLTDDLKSNLFTVMHTTVGMSWPDVISTIKTTYSLSIGEILDGINWEDMSYEQQKYFATVIAEVFSSEEVEEFITETGGDLGTEFGNALTDALDDQLKGQVKTELNKYASEFSSAGVNISEIIDDEWVFISPMIETLGLETSVELIKSIVTGAGEDAETNVRNWDLIAPYIETYGTEKSAEILNNLLYYCGDNASYILENWDLVSPYIDTDNVTDSVQSLSYFISRSGASMETILANWNLISPSVSGINTETSLLAIEQIMTQTGLDANTIISNWNLISPLIDTTNITSSVDDITKTINDNQSDWKTKLSEKLPVQKIDVEADATIKTTVEASVNVTPTVTNGKVISAGVSSAVTKVATTAIKRASNGATSILAASGAYDIPSGDVFIANENGAELVGSMKGKTTVANQNQIIEGIQKGVADANKDQNDLLREQNALLRRLLNKETSVRIGASAALGRTVQQSLNMYGGMSGGV